MRSYPAMVRTKTENAVAFAGQIPRYIRPARCVWGGGSAVSMNCFCLLLFWRLTMCESSRTIDIGGHLIQALDYDYPVCVFLLCDG